MLTVFGDAFTHCDGLSRRSFVKAGLLGLGGFSLADLLRAESSSRRGATQKSIIHIHLDGGPPQMDMIDPKPEAPADVRGTVGSISSAVPGLHLSEWMPNCARLADRMVFLRALVGADGKHNAFQCQSGFKERDLAMVGGRPALGCVVNKLLGAPSDDVPGFVDLMQGRGLVRNSCRPGFLGPAFAPFRPDISHMFPRELEDGMKVELARLGTGHQMKLELDDHLNLTRLDNRVDLLHQLDGMRRELDRSGSMLAFDRFNQQAVNMLTSGRMAKALNLSTEKQTTLDRYTAPMQESKLAFYTSEGPQAGRKLLLARRLVEAGVRVVSVSISDFDTHKKNFPRMEQLVPIFDHAFAALVSDLEERGMLDDVLVLAWGEFGRSPKINKDGGRDHWPKVSMGMMAGGGMPGGAVLGATDALAGEATDQPIHYQDVVATLYHHLGINGSETTIDDPTGRPQFLVEQGEPIRELI